MESFILGVLVVAYIAVAYVGPVVAIGLAAYWAWQAVQSGGGMGEGFVTFTISALVMLVILMIAKRVVKWLMNIADPDKEDPEAAPSE